MPKLERFKKENDKPTIKHMLYAAGIIVLLLAVFVVYKSFALYTTHAEYDVIKARIGSFKLEEMTITYTVNGEEVEDKPDNNGSYTFNSINCEDGVTADWDNDNWELANINYNGIKQAHCTVNFEAQTISNVGSYVTVVPSVPAPTKTSSDYDGNGNYIIKSSATGFASDQKVNPSELTLWRIIKVNDDGTVDVVSEYTSSTDVYFNGATGYANFIGTLNEIAKSYQNSKYTIGARMMGYNNQTEYITDTRAFNGSTTTAPSTTATPTPTSGTGEEYDGGVAGDTLYLNDYLLVKNEYENVIAYGVNDTSTAQPYWLASRRFGYNSNTDYFFRGRWINISGVIDSNHLRYYYSGWGDNNYNNRLRPILTLKSGLTIKSGSGTKEDPYIPN